MVVTLGAVSRTGSSALQGMNRWSPGLAAQFDRSLTVVDATLLGHASILFDLAIRRARAVGWRIRGGRRLRRNRSGRIFGRDWRFLLLLPLG